MRVSHRLDILANNNWKRPIYFAITTGGEAYFGLEEYFQLEGLTYRLIPVKSKTPDGQTGRVNTDILFKNMMEKFKWNSINDPKVFLSDDYIRMMMNFRNTFARLAFALINEGKYAKAITVVDKAFEVMPDNTVPFNYFVLPLAEAYYRAGAPDKGNKITARLLEIYEQNLKYFFRFTGVKATLVDEEKQQALAIMQRIAKISSDYKQADLAKKSSGLFQQYYTMYTGQSMGTPNQQ